MTIKFIYGNTLLATELHGRVEASRSLAGQEHGIKMDAIGRVMFIMVMGYRRSCLVGPRLYIQEQMAQHIN